MSPWKYSTRLWRRQANSRLATAAYLQNIFLEQPVVMGAGFSSISFTRHRSISIEGESKCLRDQ